jgi:thiamine biosynthesis lipoprotein
LDSYFIEIFKLSKSIAEDTDGSFDFTVGPLVNAWGFGFAENRNVDSLIIDSILQFVGHRKMNIDSGWLYKADERTAIDFNAIAQGYSVDLMGFFLESQNIENYLVDIGGEVKASGNKPDGSKWKIGIEKPAEHANDGRDLKAVIELKDKCVATSGNYRKFYEENGIRYSHTIDPKTGYPVQHSLLSVSVVADHAAVADAYATAFMVMGLEQCKSYLNQKKNLDAFLIYADEDGNYKSYVTEGFQKLINKEFE